MTGSVVFTREREIAIAREASHWYARQQAVNEQSLRLRQRRRAVLKAQWSNTLRVAKKRLPQLREKMVNHRFGWYGLILGQLYAAVVTALFFWQLSVPLKHPTVMPAADGGQTASAASALTNPPAQFRAPEQPLTDQLRHAAQTQLYLSTEEDGVALRFEPFLTSVSSIQPMESLP